MNWRIFLFVDNSGCITRICVTIFEGNNYIYTIEENIATERHNPSYAA
jgi:hypothetical protein